MLWFEQCHSSCMYIASSDGVTATGTFITIDRVLKQIEREDVVDIPGVIQSIRLQRMNMVDTVVCSSFFDQPQVVWVCIFVPFCHGASKKLLQVQHHQNLSHLCSGFTG